MKAIKLLSAMSLLFIFIFSASNTANAQEATNKGGTTNEQSKIAKTPAETLNPNIPIRRADENYRIGLQDVLEVTVYRHPELSQLNLRMDDTGKIHLPRIDTPILAICKTENDLSAEIANFYKQNYLRDPYVNVFIKERNSQPLSVIGAVQKPGQFFTNRQLTLIELLTYAGGQNVLIAGTKIQVVSAGGISGCNGDTKVQTAENKEKDVVAFSGYNLDDVLKGKVNPVMKPGDIVIVLDAEQIYVTGNVVTPKSVQLKQNFTLTQAIASAGGILPATKKNVVRIVRPERRKRFKAGTCLQFE